MCIGYIKQQPRYTVIGIKSGKPKSKPPPNLSKIGDLNPPKMVAHCWIYHLQDNPLWTLTWRFWKPVKESL